MWMRQTQLQQQQRRTQKWALNLGMNKLAGGPRMGWIWRGGGCPHSHIHLRNFDSYHSAFASSCQNKVLRYPVLMISPNRLACHLRQTIKYAAATQTRSKRMKRRMKGRERERKRKKHEWKEKFDTHKIAFAVSCCCRLCCCCCCCCGTKVKHKSSSKNFLPDSHTHTHIFYSTSSSEIK